MREYRGKMEDNSRPDASGRSDNRHYGILREYGFCLCGGRCERQMGPGGHPEYACGCSAASGEERGPFRAYPRTCTAWHGDIGRSAAAEQDPGRGRHPGQTVRKGAGENLCGKSAGRKAGRNSRKDGGACDSSGERGGRAQYAGAGADSRVYHIKTPGTARRVSANCRSGHKGCCERRRYPLFENRGYCGYVPLGRVIHRFTGRSSGLCGVYSLPLQQ